MSPNNGPESDDPTVIGFRPIPVQDALARREPLPPRTGASTGPIPPPPREAPPPLREPPQPTVAPPTFPQAVARPVETASLDAIQPTERPSRPEDLLPAAAATLLALASELRRASAAQNVDDMRHKVVEEIKAFESRAVEFGVAADEISAARYVLCATLDEAVMTTPWGTASRWSANSLLNQFHGETWGGEKVFIILDRIRGNPTQYLSLIKLIDLCLLFGFEGRYRVVEDGRYELDILRDEIGRLLKRHIQAPPQELSPRWRGLSARRALRPYLPLWAVFVSVGAALSLAYGIFAYRVVESVRPVITELDSLDTNQSPMPAFPPPPVTQTRTPAPQPVARTPAPVVEERAPEEERRRPVRRVEPRRQVQGPLVLTPPSRSAGSGAQ